ncbi:hypothetical protein ACK305_16005 [Aeromonas caviae]
MIINEPQKTGVRLWVEILVFISSYYPLFLILFIRDIGSLSHSIRIGLAPWNSSVSVWAICFLLISSFAMLITANFMRFFLKSHSNGVEVRVVKVNQVRGDMINYTIPFLIGLFAFDYKSWQSITSLVIFLVFMFSFLHKEKTILLNPMLLLLGIRLYDTTLKRVGQDREEEKTVICLGCMSASDIKVEFSENAGINFIYSIKVEK